MITKAIPHTSIGDVCGQEAIFLHYKKAMNLFDSEIAKKDAEIAKKDAEIAKKDAEIAKKDVEIAKKNQENLELRKKIAELEKEKDGNKNN